MPSGFLGGGVVGPRPLARQTLPDPVPVAGAELLTDGGMELDANWANYNSPTTNERSSTRAHSGTYSRRILADANLDGISQTVIVPPKTWIFSRIWIYCASGAGRNYSSDSAGNFSGNVVSAAAWSESLLSWRTNGLFSLRPYATGAAELFMDDASAVPLSLSSLLSTRAYASPDCDLSAAITLTSGTQAGLVGRLDSASSPANFLIAYLDGGGNVKVDKCVAGVYTNVISGAVTYAAGRVLRLVCSGNDVSAYYNGTQVGSTVTVSDAGIVSNTRHGKFSTYAANSINSYTSA